jgi:tetratricopeptide (TPR) repeat protein
MKLLPGTGAHKTRVAAFVIVILGAFLGIGYYSYVSLSVPHYPVASQDSVSSWNFPSAYAKGSEDEKRVQTEIDKLKALLGKQESDYEVLVGIAAEYELLGEGQKSYLYLSKAISDSPNKALAYFSIGHLFERVGALYSAKQTYGLAVEKEPGNTLYKEYLDQFLNKYAEQAKKTK